MEELLHLFDALLGQRHNLVLLIYDKVSGLLDFLAHDGSHLGNLAGSLTALKLCRQNITRLIELRGFSALAGNDQRGAGFIDQNRVNLIDDRISKISLHHLILVYHHVVTKIIKTVLIVCDIGDVTVVLGTALIILHAVQNASYGQTQELMNLSHPARVTARQIIIDGDDVHSSSREGVQISRHRGYEGFSFTGLHLRDTSLMKNDSADNLNSVGFHTQYTFCRLPYGCKCFRQKVIQCLAARQAVLVLLRLGAKLIVAERLHGGTIGFYLVYDRLNSF